MPIPGDALIDQAPGMISIRREQPEDLAAIRRVNIAALGQAVEADIVDTIRRNCRDIASLVAVAEAQIVGHILFSPVLIEGEARSQAGMGLGPMAVLPEFQRHGVGTALVEAGMEEMKERGCAFVMVLGHADYYPRFGFIPASRLGIQCEWDVPDSAFMITGLSDSGLREMTGIAKYRPEFAAAV